LTRPAVREYRTHGTELGEDQDAQSRRALHRARALTTQDKEKLFVEDKDGFIVIEAEHFHHKVDKDPHKWVATKEPAGFSGDGAMEAKPNEDANNDAEDYRTSARAWTTR
jgi:hypothetical protein